MTRLQAVIRFVKLLHHLILLRFGRYCTIAERLLKLQTFANGSVKAGKFTFMWFFKFFVLDALQKFF